jgi:hypothetical protein
MLGRLHLGASCRRSLALPRTLRTTPPANLHQTRGACSSHLTSPHLDTGAIETELELCVYPDHAPVGQGQLLRSMHACMHWRSSFFR